MLCFTCACLALFWVELKTLIASLHNLYLYQLCSDIYLIIVHALNHIDADLDCMPISVKS